MPGIDSNVLGMIDPELSLSRIRYDVRSDFILSPHYSSVYANVSDDLWSDLSSSLRSGSFEPDLPITIEVPKRSGLTRPGSILFPKDRLVYQALADLLAPLAEDHLDRSRVYSNVLLDPDPNFAMFEPSSACWGNLQSSIRANCLDGSFTHAIKADVANYFERLYQHNLVNLLHTCGCPGGAVNLLEELFLSWMERDSHGILQGMFPSDFLGNFCLVGVDSDYSVRNVPSARYVDDIYAFYPSIEAARVGLVDLTHVLRQEGLHLNESKSSVLEVEHLLYEETEIDRLFQAAREELEQDAYVYSAYGFEFIWIEEDEEEADDTDYELLAVEALYQRVDDVEERVAEKIEKFCLPIFASAENALGLDRALVGMVSRPHLSGLYSSYLSSIARSNPAILISLEDILQDRRIPYDWQLMFLIAPLIRAESVRTQTVTLVFRIMRDMSRCEALRGLCAILIGKHGNAGHRRNLRNHYADEPSSYVRSAVLFASRYFPTAERRTCIGAWGGHSSTNSLIARTVKLLAK